MVYIIMCMEIFENVRRRTQLCLYIHIYIYSVINRMNSERRRPEGLM